MAYDRKLARRNIEITIERSKQALAEPDPAAERQVFPGARASITRALAEARGALEALNDGESPQGWA